MVSPLSIWNTLKQPLNSDFQIPRNEAFMQMIGIQKSGEYKLWKPCEQSHSNGGRALGIPFLNLVDYSLNIK